MTEHHTAPSLIELERHYESTPRQVFEAWSSAEALTRWGTPGPGWTMTLDAFEFEVGGRQISRFSPGNDSEMYVNRSQFHDIVPGARIVSSGSMTLGGTPLFVGVLTIELADADGGCLLRLTEQGVFLDGHDRSENHVVGWNSMLDRIAPTVAIAVVP